MRTVEGIAKYKKENELPILDVLREREKIDKITDLVSDDMASYTRLLYNTIMEMSKDHQRKSESGGISDDSRRQRPSTKRRKFFRQRPAWLVRAW